MILCLSKPTTKRPTVWWPTLGADYELGSKDEWWVECPTGDGLVDTLVQSRSIPVGEYLERQANRLSAPASSLSPGSFSVTSRRDFEKRLVRDNDILWIDDSAVGKLFFRAALVALHEVGWDVMASMDGRVRAVLGVRSVSDMKRGGTINYREAILDGEDE